MPQNNDHRLLEDRHNAAVWLLPSTGALAVEGFNILPWILPTVMTIAVAEGILLSLGPRGYD